MKKQIIDHIKTSKTHNNNEYLYNKEIVLIKEKRQIEEQLKELKLSEPKEELELEESEYLIYLLNPTKLSESEEQQFFNIINSTNKYIIKDIQFIPYEQLTHLLNKDQSIDLISIILKIIVIKQSIEIKMSNIYDLLFQIEKILKFIPNNSDDIVINEHSSSKDIIMSAKNIIARLRIETIIHILLYKMSILMPSVDTTPTPKPIDKYNEIPRLHICLNQLIFLIQNVQAVISIKESNTIIKMLALIQGALFTQPRILSMHKCLPTEEDKNKLLLHEDDRMLGNWHLVKQSIEKLMNLKQCKECRCMNINFPAKNICEKISNRLEDTNKLKLNKLIN